MKKTISILACLLLSLSAGIYYYMNQPKNIFDEIYQETERTYRMNNILGKIDGFNIRAVWPADSDSYKYTPFGTYEIEEEGSDYSNIRVGFNFKRNRKTVSISFRKKLDSKISLSLWNMYSAKDKYLAKTVEIVIKENGSHNYIEDETQVRSYLNKHGITAKDLDAYYEKIVNQKVLKDWCSIYKSKYSPKDYGQVTVKTQWEKW